MTNKNAISPRRALGEPGRIEEEGEYQRALWKRPLLAIPPATHPQWAWYFDMRKNPDKYTGGHDE